MAATPTDKSALIEWLTSAIDDLPGKGQIVLNIDSCTVAWEVKATYAGGNDPHERLEIKRSGRLKLVRR